MATDETEGRKNDTASNGNPRLKSKKWLCRPANIMNVLTLFIAVAALVQIHYTQSQFDFTREDRRPWVGAPIVDFSNSPDERIMTFKNVGHMPTHGLYINAAIVSQKFNEQQMVERLCKEGKDATKRPELFTFFSMVPDSLYPLHEIASLDGSTLDLSTIKSGDFAETPYIAGCIIYGWPKLTDIHQTGFLIRFKPGTLTVVGSYPVTPD